MIKIFNLVATDSGVTNNGAISTTGTPITTGNLDVTSWNGTSTKYINVDGYYVFSLDRTVERKKNDSWTMAFWMYQKSNYSGNYSMLSWDSNNATRHRSIQVADQSNDDSNTVGMRTTSNFLGLKAKQKTTLNKWTHVAVCSVNGVVSLYIDGVKQGESNVTRDEEITSPSVGYYNMSNTYFDDIVMVHGKALFTGDFTPSTVPLLDSKILIIGEDKKVYKVVV